MVQFIGTLHVGADAIRVRTASPVLFLNMLKLYLHFFFFLIGFCGLPPHAPPPELALAAAPEHNEKAMCQKYGSGFYGWEVVICIE